MYYDKLIARVKRYAGLENHESEKEMCQMLRNLAVIPVLLPRLVGGD